jgi:hypothetical protein
MFFLQTKSLWQILIENNSVPLGLIGVLAYFIKRIFDLKSRKVEIRYTLFHQNKLKYIIEFQASYFEVEKAISVFIKEVVKRKLRPALDIDISSKLDRFNDAHENMRFFVGKLYRPYFDRMSKNLTYFVETIEEFENKQHIWHEEERGKKLHDFKTIYWPAFKLSKIWLVDFYDNYIQELEKDKLSDRRMLKSLKQMKPPNLP